MGELVISKTTAPFAIYDAFTDVLFGGSQGGIVLDAGQFSSQTRQSIASELGLPATCFVASVTERTVTARFHSTQREYPMCGHGTICLMTYLLDENILKLVDGGTVNVELALPTTTAQVEIIDQGAKRPLVMLDIAPPALRNDQPDIDMLASVLGLSASDIDANYPVETAVGDFVHLLVPIKNLATIQSITPDFAAITNFCHQYGFETIACFCAETVQVNYDFHVRDFCPAVGVDESAAAGTTNAALAVYWHRHGLVASEQSGKSAIRVEQGLELNRPSAIHTTIHLQNNEISRLQVGGVATKVLAGQLELPKNGVRVA